MSTVRIDLSLPLAGLEAAARIASIGSIALLALLFIGEGFHPSRVAPQEWIGLFFFPIGIIAGMVVAWCKEGLGSAVTLGSLLGFYLVYGNLLGNHIGGWWFVIFASPGFLFLLHWLLRPVGKKPVTR